VAQPHGARQWSKEGEKKECLSLSLTEDICGREGYLPKDCQEASERKRRGMRSTLQRHTPSHPLPPIRPHLLIAHSAMNSARIDSPKLVIS
jgi:hypothetical protein